MDKIILGILMLNRMTAYEIKNVIKLSYKSICSDSLGSIQAALKKLFDLEMVTFEEVVENGVNKKRYAITELGQGGLLEWLKIPIDNSKTRNIELAKIIFLGYSQREQQELMIDKVILSLEEEYESLLESKKSIDVTSELSQLESYLNKDEQYRERLLSLCKDEGIPEKIKEISKFSYATLDYGIELLKFNIKWFKKFKKNL